ncbi:MAG: biotin/lipoyl-binding protein [Spirochaetales bacterium]|nr:biotin/lipoyl-binding protein [Spirochaetales bacterium]
MNYRQVFRGLVLLGSTVALVSCNQGAAGAKPQAGYHGHKSAESTGRGPTAVLSTKAVFRELTTDREVAGSVEPVVQSPVAPQISGVVAKVYHLAGDYVRKGEPVYKIDDSQLLLTLKTAETALANAKLNYDITKSNNDQNGPKLRLQVQSAQASVDVAEKGYEASKQLYAIGGASSTDVATAQAQFQSAQANLEAAKIALSQYKDADQQTLAQLKLAIQTAEVQVEQAKLSLSYTVVYAPYSGQLTVVNVNPGQYVTPASQSFTMVGPQKQIVFNVVPSDAISLTVGRPAMFTVAGVAYPLTVSSFPGAPVNGLLPMTAMPKEPIKVPFGVVGTVRYEVVVAKGAVVPVSALQSDGSVSYVFTVSDNKSVKTPITVLGEAGTLAAVSGIADQTVVIDSPPPGLLPGAPIRLMSDHDSNQGGQL